MFSLFHNYCILIDADFQGKSTDVHYLRVVLLSLSIINQTLFQRRWIESGRIQENYHFYLFVIVEQKGSCYAWREIVTNLPISLADKKFEPCAIAVRKNHALNNI
jgi:hypothetical protein